MHRRPAGRQPGAQRVEAGAVDGAQREHRHGAAQRRAHVEHRAGRVVAQVGLRQDDDRLGLRVGGEREEALDPAQVEVAVERPDDERDVDVRGEHLRLGAAVARGARDPAAARQQRVDDAGVRVRRDPVADRGQVGGASPRRGSSGRTACRRAGRPRSARSSRPRCTAATRAGIRSGRASAAKRGVEARGPAEGGEAAGYVGRQRGSPSCEGDAARRARQRRAHGHGAVAGGASGGRRAERQARRSCESDGAAEASRVQGTGAAVRARATQDVVVPRAASGSQRPSLPTPPWTGRSWAGSPSRL